MVTDLRVLNAIAGASKKNTRNPKLVINKTFKYLDAGYVITPVTYKGKKYVSRYIDGCFYPYITELNTNK